MVHHPEHHDLIDQNRVLRSLAQRVVRQSLEHVERRHHEWRPIAAGRVCGACLIAQMKGEFDDNVACNPRDS
jgi:hypothetical protein